MPADHADLSVSLAIVRLGQRPRALSTRPCCRAHQTRRALVVVHGMLPQMPVAAGAQVPVLAVRTRG